MLKFAYEFDLIFIILFVAIIPVFVFYYRAKRDIIKKFFLEVPFVELIENKDYTKEIIRFLLFFFAGVMLIIALARPQVGTKVETVKQTGIDVFFLLDVSNSMAAEDLKPSRLEKAKNDIEIMLKKMAGDRIGMIIFAGQSYLQFPLTLDHSIGKLILSTIDIGSIPQQGTDIAGAMELAIKSFSASNNKGKAVIIFSDGENHEKGAEEAIKEAVGEGIRVYTVALGSPDGAKIPIYSGDIITGYKVDGMGEEVVTKVDETMLKKLASSGGGQFFRSDDNSEYLVKLYDEISSIEKSEFGTFKVVEYEEVFHWFLFPAIVLLFAEFFIRDRRKQKVKNDVKQ
ncbi:MAG: VWA domain-containing protein [Ignavibacteriales bacterium]|nr:VWA domain-containing protein [Ignavibacteriales bacterium]